MASDVIKSHQMTPCFINQGMDMATGVTPPFPSSYVDAWRIKFSFVYSCWHGYISAWWLYCYAPTNSGCIWYPHPLPTIMWQKCGGKYAEWFFSQSLFLPGIAWLTAWRIVRTACFLTYLWKNIWKEQTDVDIAWVFLTPPPNKSVWPVPCCLFQKL